MAGASDKARFYLEQSIPELQEFERKKIFSKVLCSSRVYQIGTNNSTQDEITSITKKRSDFEHKLNARGSQPSDYVRYVEFEMNLESLRRKRVKRLGIKSSNHSGQRRIFFVLDRATRKFHGDLGLWVQYIEYARKEKASKKLSQVFTSVLRLHPTKPDLWMYAARYAADGADITSARSYMQRGLRFCRTSKALWIEYAKLEMTYVAKIAARRQILGLDGSQPEDRKATEDNESNPDVIALPKLTAEDINPSLRRDDELDQIALQNFNSAPALTGAIPLAIFDSAMKQFANDDSLAEMLFNLFAGFEGAPCLPKILQHVVDHMLKTWPTMPSSLSSYSRQPIVGIDPHSAEFPRAFGVCLERIRSSTQKAQGKSEFIERVIYWLLQLKVTGLDAGVQKAISATVKRTARDYGEAAEQEGGLTKDDSMQIVGKLQNAGYQKEAEKLLDRCRQRCGMNEQPLDLQVINDRDR
ncbi:MAG: U3 snoRNP protein [Trichoglossum hirsutum]|jgi:U3 small nucleolar RNA-associated protein 6|nr:MAG: U3 snoRNP protein [Trichoglossum hirsutum]